jgi:hypothetical protein
MYRVRVCSCVCVWGFFVVQWSALVNMCWPVRRWGSLVLSTGTLLCARVDAQCVFRDRTPSSTWFELVAARLRSRSVDLLFSLQFLSDSVKHVWSCAWEVPWRCLLRLFQSFSTHHFMTRYYRLQSELCDAVWPSEQPSPHDDVKQAFSHSSSLSVCAFDEVLKPWEGHVES